ncbi:unnamed protein product [Durusdinium trenchii]|uniref:Uncharacterized protein n=1 Tax=Durusdinium trenchii TaxID=1381693 RepID=A0ABP0N3S6_9DINO
MPHAALQRNLEELQALQRELTWSDRPSLPARGHQTRRNGRVLRECTAAQTSMAATICLFAEFKNSPRVSGESLKQRQVDEEESSNPAFGRSSARGTGSGLGQLG